MVLKPRRKVPAGDTVLLSAGNVGRRLYAEEDGDVGEEFVQEARFHREGGTVLLVTHQQSAAACAQRTIQLRDGSIQ